MRVVLPWGTHAAGQWKQQQHNSGLKQYWKPLKPCHRPNCNDCNCKIFMTSADACRLCKVPAAGICLQSSPRGCSRRSSTSHGSHSFLCYVLLCALQAPCCKKHAAGNVLALSAVYSRAEAYSLGRHELSQFHRQTKTKLQLVYIDKVNQHPGLHTPCWDPPVTLR